MAVNALYLHAAERGWIKPPYFRPAASPDYVEALIRLADDAGWLALEIPLPDHPAPHHPPIYYTIEQAGNRPTPRPRPDALIRGDYLYDLIHGRRATRTDTIRPWRGPDVQSSLREFAAWSRG